MLSYTPRFSHVVISTLLGIALLWLSAPFKDGRTALTIGAIAFFVSAGVFLWTHIMAANDNSVDAMERFASTYIKLDDEGRAALAFRFPAMRYRMKRGRVREYFEDTSATIEQFRMFLQTSNDKYISPERDWCTTEKPRAIWIDIKEYLEREGHILPESAAGSHSWLWNGNAYRHLMAYWMAGRELKDIGERVYTYEEEGV